MQGNKKVIDRLNEALKLELGAVNQYWLHYRMLANWGYSKLAKKERAESIEEMQHADKLIDRIIFLEGLPNLQTVAPLMIGEDLKEVLECDLKGEHIAREALAAGEPTAHLLDEAVEALRAERLRSALVAFRQRRGLIHALGAIDIEVAHDVVDGDERGVLGKQVVLQA